MTPKTRDRFLGLSIAALLVTIGGDLLAMPLLLTVGVTGFFLAVAGLFALMTVSLVVGLRQRSGPDAPDPVLAEPAFQSTPPNGH